MENDQLLNSVEATIQRKFLYREHILWLLTLSENEAKKGCFEEILFSSKFLSRAGEIFGREGMEHQTLEPLRKEFQVHVEKLHELLHVLMNEADEPQQGVFVSRFLAMTPESIGQLLALAQELTWLKNYYLDQART